MELQTKIIRDYKHLARLLKDGQVFTAFDTETTGLKVEDCHIIEIGAVKFSSQGIQGRFNTLINPGCPISYFCTQINHITNEMVSNAPKIQQILPDFLNFIKDTIIVAHNAAFDLRFLQMETERLNLPAPQNEAIDTLHFCRWAHPDWKKYKQTIVAERMGITVKDAHRAYDDAFVCGNIFLQCIKDTADKQK
ncbi:MAG: 3'-5' exonuclease [Treponema sp.]|nr:3'-5' exonuclease [Treponema sp.]MBD5443002.1 3'-5' exonuclease [Treponema sp.]